MFRGIFNYMQGRRQYQRLFDVLYRTGLRGMGYGNGGNAAMSGEDALVKRIYTHYAGTNGLVIFDGGANVGNYSILLAGIFGQQASIHAFEPSAQTFAILQANTKQLGNLHANNMGLGEMEETQTLFLNYEGSAMASLYQRDLKFIDVALDKKEEIKLTTVDAYCLANHITRIHFLKLDIEGHELSALQGAAAMMQADAIDLIQFEFGGCNIDSKTYFKDFYNLLHEKYIIYRILRNGLAEMKGYRETYEIFTAVNYLAKRRTLAAF
jgi:FkbM family methyltransferase